MAPVVAWPRRSAKPSVSKSFRDASIVRLKSIQKNKLSWKIYLTEPFNSVQCCFIKGLGWFGFRSFRFGYNRPFRDCIRYLIFWVFCLLKTFLVIVLLLKVVEKISGLFRKLTLIIWASFEPNGPVKRFCLYLEKSNEASDDSISIRLVNTGRKVYSFISSLFWYLLFDSSTRLLWEQACQ